MKIIFLLDNSEFIEVEPTKLQLRQMAPGTASIGVEVTVPVRNEDGTPKVVDGQTQMQVAFRPFINYPVSLAIPKTAKAPKKKAPKKQKRGK